MFFVAYPEISFCFRGGGRAEGAGRGAADKQRGEHRLALEWSQVFVFFHPVSPRCMPSLDVFCFFARRWVQHSFLSRSSGRLSSEKKKKNNNKKKRVFVLPGLEAPNLCQHGRWRVNGGTAGAHAVSSVNTPPPPHPSPKKTNVTIFFFFSFTFFSVSILVPYLLRQRSSVARTPPF